MKRSSEKTFRIIGWAIIAASIAGGVVMGAVFRMPDADLQGRPEMVFDFWLTLCVWLAGGIVGLLVMGRAWNRK
jgi:hypothetical protein